MALTKAQLLTEIGNTIDAAVAAPNKRAQTVIILEDLSMKIIIQSGKRRDVSVSIL